MEERQSTKLNGEGGVVAVIINHGPDKVPLSESGARGLLALMRADIARAVATDTLVAFDLESADWEGMVSIRLTPDQARAHVEEIEAGLALFKQRLRAQGRPISETSTTVRRGPKGEIETVTTYEY